MGRRMSGARRPAVLVLVLLGLLAGLLSVSVPTAGAEETGPSDLKYEDSCIYIPMNVSGSQWYYVCPQQNWSTSVVLRNEKNERINGWWQPDNISGGPPWFNFTSGTDEYKDLVAEQESWAGLCTDQCAGTTDKRAVAPKSDGYGPDSFWGNNNENADASSPCEFLEPRTQRKINCVDPRIDPNKPEDRNKSLCPEDRLPGGGPTSLLEKCRAATKAFHDHFKYGERTPEQPSACGTVAAAACDRGDSRPVTTAGYDPSIKFLDDPIAWTKVNLGAASATVSAWWVNSPDPVINNDTGYKLEQNVDFLVRHTNVITYFLVIVSILIAAVRMALTRDATPARDVLKSIATLIVVSGLSVMVVNALVRASSYFSSWVLIRGLDPSNPQEITPENTSKATKEALATLTGAISDSNLNFFVFLIVAVCLIASSLMNYFYMTVAFFMVIVLTGTLPLATAATNTEAGRSWMRGHLSYLAAFIMLKPATVLVFVAGARMWAPQSNDPLTTEMQFRGVFVLMLITILLPALLRIVTPIVSPAAGSDGANAALAGGMLVTGAKAVGGATKVVGKIIRR